MTPSKRQAFSEIGSFIEQVQFWRMEMTFVAMEVQAMEMEQWQRDVEFDRQLEEQELAEAIRQVEGDWQEYPADFRGHYFYSKKYKVGVYAAGFDR
jgi:hypothetical protein